MGRKKRFKYFAWPVGTQGASYLPYGQNLVKARTASHSVPRWLTIRVYRYEAPIPRDML